MSFRSTLYVGNVAYSSQAADLANLFSKCGNVLSTEIKRGYAFVKFDNVESAQAAIHNFNNYLFNGRNIRVNFSKSEPHPSRIAPLQSNPNINPNPNQLPNTSQQVPPQQTFQQRVPYKENSIHVANLPFNITEEQLGQEFESFGVLSVHLIRNRNCFAIIELSSLENSTAAIEQKKGLIIDGREIVVSRQVELLPERQYFYYPRGKGGRGRGRGFRRGIFRNRGFRQYDQFTLTNDLHLNNDNSNSINNNSGNVNINSNISPNLNNNQNNHNPISNDRSGFRYKGDIFRGRGRGRGRGHYRGRGLYGRSRSRGFRARRGSNINEVFSHINVNHANNAINNPQ